MVVLFWHKIALSPLQMTATTSVLRQDKRNQTKGQNSWHLLEGMQVLERFINLYKIIN